MTMKELIISMIEKIDDEDVIRAIYEFLIRH